MPDRLFSESRLAEIYDPLDPDRTDLEAYLDIVAEFNAASVLDLGCGTGTFATLLASRGIDVVAVDPAAASLEIAQRKPGANQVRWVHGDASNLPPLQVDMVTMTGNVAQVFLTDLQWMSTLRAARHALRPGGRLVFETRDPAAEAWRGWTRELTYRRTDIGVGAVENWIEVTGVTETTVSFVSTFIFASDGAVLTSESRLRFRHREELHEALTDAGFDQIEVRDAA